MLVHYPGANKKRS